MGDIQPLAYLITSSRISLESYELLRLNLASNLRKEMLQLLDKWVDAETEARMARAILEWNRGKNERSEYPASSPELLSISPEDVTVFRMTSRFLCVSRDRKEAIEVVAKVLQKRQGVRFCVDGSRPHFSRRMQRAMTATSVLRMLERPSRKAHATSRTANL